jgi:hypothetical protein
MNTTLRTSVHTCIVTREAVEHMLAESATGQVEAAMMPLPDMRDLVAV